MKTFDGRYDEQGFPPLARAASLGELDDLDALLVAGDPKRWSAIVPICHGGDRAVAAKLVGIPCWCFHGEADRVIPAQQSREMIEAITKAGGRPLYQEFPGVGHNDCADRVYAMNDLYEWLLMQDRSQR
jgi:predicted peptidase